MNFVSCTRPNGELRGTILYTWISKEQPIETVEYSVVQYL